MVITYISTSDQNPCLNTSNKWILVNGMVWYGLPWLVQKFVSTRIVWEAYYYHTICKKKTLITKKFQDFGTSILWWFFAGQFFWNLIINKSQMVKLLFICFKPTHMLKMVGLSFPSRYFKNTISNVNRFVKDLCSCLIICWYANIKLLSFTCQSSLFVKNRRILFNNC